MSEYINTFKVKNGNKDKNLMSSSINDENLLKKY